MIRTGIMGGTFNPIHMGHLILAQFALDELSLDEVLFMPSKNPPHKKNNDILCDEIRSDMIKCAIEDNPKFVFSDFELKREGTTYTADTLSILHNDKSNEDKEFYFLMGADSFLAIESWYKPSVILKLCHIVVAVRDNVSITELKNHYNNLKQKYGDFYTHFVTMPNIDISSSSIRQSIQDNSLNRYLVPHKVYEYIIDKGVYR